MTEVQRGQEPWESRALARSNPSMGCVSTAALGQPQPRWQGVEGSTQLATVRLSYLSELWVGRIAHSLSVQAIAVPVTHLNGGEG